MLTQAPLSTTMPSSNERIASYRHHAIGSLVTIWRDQYVPDTHVAVWQASSGAVIGISVIGNVRYLQQTLTELGYEVADA